MSEDKPKPLDKPPTSKLGRLARLAGLAPRAIPSPWPAPSASLAARAPRAQDAAAHEQMGDDVKKAADAMLKTFGEMKGLPSSPARWRATSTASPRPATKSASRPA